MLSTPSYISRDEKKGEGERTNKKYKIEPTGGREEEEKRVDVSINLPFLLCIKFAEGRRGKKRRNKKIGSTKFPSLYRHRRRKKQVKIKESAGRRGRGGKSRNELLISRGGVSRQQVAPLCVRVEGR